MSQQTRIHILPPDVANKIAAGEVVERPASVVKELVENAIDAEATEITIILKNGGKEWIQVVDNGMGMTGEELKLAFQRHATSKIETAEDLHAIETLGFRGEALASIASVSRVEAKSIPRGNISGTELVLEGGRIVQEKPVGGTSGTTFTVKTLFFNTPARRKFLRADATEYRHCLTVANRFALCYPNIQFTLVHNSEVIWDVQPEPLKDRICHILGKRLQNMLVQVEDDAGAVKINGFVGTQDTVRRNRGEQYLFLNGRYIQDRSLHHAIISAYGEILAHGGHPLYVLQLHIDPARVDVNVHPTKMEVKFADDRLIYSLVRSAVKRALISAKVVPDLHQPGSSLPQTSTERWLEKDWTPTVRPAIQGGTAFPADAFEKQPPAESQTQLDFDTAAPEGSFYRSGETGTPSEPTAASLNAAPADVWQMHNRYILTQVKSGLVIIDQHVAHERILYEQALKRFENSQPVSQKVLFPRMIELNAEDYDILKEMMPFLEKLGFIIQEFGKNTVVVEGVPADIKIKDYNKLLQDMIDDYKRGKRSQLEIRDNIAKTFACHSAIRSGDRLTIGEMKALIEQLFATETPYFCPHGRPVLVNLSLEELDKRFGRI